MYIILTSECHLCTFKLLLPFIYNKKSPGQWKKQRNKIKNIIGNVVKAKKKKEHVNLIYKIDDNLT